MGFWVPWMTFLSPCRTSFQSENHKRNKLAVKPETSLQLRILGEITKTGLASGSSLRREACPKPFLARQGISGRCRGQGRPGPYHSRGLENGLGWP